MRVTVDLPIPDGWELADEKMRAPNNGEWFMYIEGNIIFQCSPATDYDGPCWIVRKKWTWPKELKDGKLLFCFSKCCWCFTTSDGTQLLNIERFLTTEMPPDKDKVYFSSDYK